MASRPYITGKGFVFEGNHEWDQVGEEGHPVFLECRSCFVGYEVPSFQWA